jgi:hypothetical protein
MHLIHDISEVLHDQSDLSAAQINKEAADGRPSVHILRPSDCWTTTAATTVPPDEQ